MHVDFKITTWERVEISDEIADEVLKQLKSGESSTANDLCDKFPDEAIYSGEIPDTSVQMTIEENDGAATIEFFSEPRSDASWTNEEK